MVRQVTRGAAPMQYRIPFNKPDVLGNELDYVAQAVRSGKISGDGGFTAKCHALLETALGAERVLLTTSCTHALEMAALLLDISPGDEVIVPSFTFVSTANAFVLRGARPVFVDVRPDTLNLDEQRLERAISPKTKAIVPVHYAGVACEMDAITALAKEYNLSVVEDNAHGLFGSYKGRCLGTFGTFAAQSFHETKNFSCGEGGALVINDPAYAARAEIIREKGTDRGRYFRGEIDKYTWVDLGSSYLPSDLLAAFLFAQLERREQIQAARRTLWQTYKRELEGWADANGVQLPTVPPHCEQAYHMFYLILPSAQAQAGLIEHLRNKGILSVFHYLPLHLSIMGLKSGAKAGDCPVTEQMSERLLRLPFYNTMSEEEQEEVIAGVRSFQCAT